MGINKLGLEELMNLFEKENAFKGFNLKTFDGVLGLGRRLSLTKSEKNTYAEDMRILGHRLVEKAIKLDERISRDYLHTVSIRNDDNEKWNTVHIDFISILDTGNYVFSKDPMNNIIFTHEKGDYVKCNFDNRKSYSENFLKFLEDNNFVAVPEYKLSCPMNDIINGSDNHLKEKLEEYSAENIKFLHNTISLNEGKCFESDGKMKKVYHISGSYCVNYLDVNGSVREFRYVPYIFDKPVAWLSQYSGSTIAILDIGNNIHRLLFVMGVAGKLHLEIVEVTGDNFELSVKRLELEELDKELIKKIMINGNI